MKFSVDRLDRFISKHSAFAISQVRLLIAQKRIVLDGSPAVSAQQKVTKFTRVLLDGVCLQELTPVYIMLNKPRGVVSATKDARHTTVIDLLEHRQKDELHIAGRLDFNTTGLLLLSNDGAWSRRLSLPETKLIKTYKVTLSKPLNDQYTAAFHQGVYFAYEGITTLPAHLEILSERTALLSIVEGKYHQIKRMFAVFKNQVLTLHRTAVGPIVLGDLKPGQSRLLTSKELSLSNS